MTRIHFFIDNSKIYPRGFLLWEGDNGYFKCLSRSKVKWNYNNEELPSNAVTHNITTILITNVTLLNNGKYFMLLQQLLLKVSFNHNFAQAVSSADSLSW